MTWSKWYAVRSYVRSSLWIVPFVALLLEQLAIHAAGVIDQNVDWVPAWPFDQAGTIAALGTIITLTASFMVFTFGSMLIAIQVASGQLTPRVIATTLLRDNVIRFAVGLFVFTLLFAIGAQSRIGVEQRRLVIWIAGLLGLTSIAAFLYLIDYAARLLRPGSILWRTGEQGIAVIEHVYATPTVSGGSAPAPWPAVCRPEQVICHRSTSGIVLAVNLKSMVAEAERCDVVVEFVPRVGDFVPVGQPLFLIHGRAGTVDEDELRGAVAFGPERTLEQDSTFAFRVIVDIALKALSKAINDPTTAVLAIDQLHNLLRRVGMREIRDGHIADASGRLRLVFRTPNWEDFVQLTCREIRFNGVESVQIARRLRAMIENLLATLPESRRPALLEELSLLDRAIESYYRFPEDLALARTPDMQGIGGSSGHVAARH
jgi:uncharacterized membrane protein